MGKQIDVLLLSIAEMIRLVLHQLTVPVDYGVIFEGHLVTIFAALFETL